MDTKQVLTLLSGALVGIGGTLGTQELKNEEVLIDGEETPPIVEEIPAIPAVIYADNVCGENKLHTSIGEVHLCADEATYTSVKNSIIEDVQTTETRYINEKGELCEKDSEGCKEEVSHIKWANKDTFPVMVLKEDMKDGKIDFVNVNQIDPVTAKEQILEILGEIQPSLEIVK
jgi:hypothetical protein